PAATEPSMRRVKYFVAMSLDAQLAGPHGEIDWLFTDGHYGAKEFFATVDTALVGRRTYEFMLSMGERTAGMTTYVFSRTLKPADYPEVTIVADGVVELVAALRARDAGRDIWLVGGGALFGTLLDAGLVDDVQVAVHPIILGPGLPFVEGATKRAPLRLRGVKQYGNGLLALDYEVGGGR
ncbi:MAG TPA: dihydrofolate reductase family protein, partial [Gemmatimonadaceae bacterium]|nr:dihydrofolate reductase family protein [Gemmatimonadaceae bacterium]